MPDAPGRRHVPVNSPGCLIAAGLAAVAVVVGVWLAARALLTPPDGSAPVGATPLAAAAATSTPIFVVVQVTPAAVTPVSFSASPTPVPPSPFPTALPTQTPLPTPTSTATPLPTPTFTPTPIPMPIWRNIGELAMVEYTLATEAEAKVEREGLLQLFGTDRVILYAVGRVKVGLDLTQLDERSIQRRGAAITLTLPAVSVLSVEMLPQESRIRVAERSWLYSEYEGLELAALERARRQLAELVANNPSMMSLAQELAELRLREHLRGLGFEQVRLIVGRE